MITITIGLEEYLDLQLRGMREYCIIGVADYKAITAQPGWEGVCHLEPVQNGQESSKDGISEPFTHPNNLVDVKPLWQLWHRKEWQESATKRSQAKAASEHRVKAHNDFQRKCIIGKNKMILSGKVPLEKIDEIFKDLDKFPVVKAAIERIVLPSESSL